MTGEKLQPMPNKAPKPEQSSMEAFEVMRMAEKFGKGCCLLLDYSCLLNFN
jgi:hypothetical protein